MLTDDPSALREAALLSLKANLKSKSKRKKSGAANGDTVNGYPQSLKGKREGVDREEGEISDEEMAVALALDVPTTTATLEADMSAAPKADLYRFQFIPPSKLLQQSPTQTSQLFELPKPGQPRYSATPRPVAPFSLKLLPQRPSLPSSSETRPEPQMQSSHLDPESPLSSEIHPSPSHSVASPASAGPLTAAEKLGLPAEDIYRIKVLILDFLGWGISANDILELSDASPATIATCMAELRLRLPPSLSAFVLTEPLKNLSHSAVPLSDSKTQSNPQMPSSQHRPITNNIASLPSKPVVSAIGSPVPRIPTSQQPTIPSIATPPIQPLSHPGSPSPLSSANLQQIETMRKQELLARRAALLALHNRESRSSAASPRTESTTPSSTRPAPALPSTGAQQLARNGSLDADQDLDILIANVIRDSEVQSVQGQSTPITDSSTSTSAFFPNGDSHHSGDLRTASPEVMDMDMDRETHPPVAGPSRVSPLHPVRVTAQNSVWGAKRGTKRPVAADFVEEEDAGIAPYPNGTNHSPNPAPLPPYLRTRGSFAPAMPRTMILEFSDSDDDSDNDLAIPRTHSSTPPQPQSRPTTNGATSAQSVVLIAAAAAKAELERKESEIKRISEKIRMMEEKKKRKVATSTTNSPCPTPALQPINAKDESTPATVTNGQTSATSHPPSPPPGSLSKANENLSPSVLNPEMKFEESPPPPSLDKSEGHELKDSPVAATSATTIHDAEVSELRYPDGPLSDPEIIDVDMLDGDDPPPQISNIIDVDALDLPDEVQYEAAPTSIQTPTDHAADVKLQATNSRFLPYISPLSCHPNLRLQLDFPSDSATTVHSTSFSSNPPFPYNLDLKPLLFAGFRNVPPDQKICKFEVPGGGTCRNDHCEDFHLRDYEPNDDKTAAYLLTAIPGPHPFTEEQIKHTLKSVQSTEGKQGKAVKQQTLDFRARVAVALNILINQAELTPSSRV